MKDTHYGVALLLALFLTMPLSTSAQHHYEFGLDLGMAIPQGAFDTHTDQSGFGIGVHGGMQVHNTPLFLGIDGGAHVYGTETRHVPLSNTIPDIVARVRTTNNIAQLHGLLRLQPVTGKVRPYLEGLYGFKYLFTSTSLENVGTDESVLSSTNHDDITPSFGGGGGVDVQVFHGPMGESGQIGRVYVTFGARYLASGEAEYLREGDITRENGQVYYTPTRSRVDTIQPRLGVTLAF